MKEKFTNLRTLQLQASRGEEVKPVFFSNSQIFFEPARESRSGTQTTELLNACIKAGIFKNTVTVGSNSLKHTNSGLTFVELASSNQQKTFNVSANLTAPDPRKFILSGDFNSLSDAKRLSVITGPCLFSASGARARLENGNSVNLCVPGSLDGITQKITDITIDERLQAYEIDSIIRVTQFIRELDTSRRTVDLRLNIPRVEYYCYVLDSFQKGLIDSEVTNKWFDFVDNRARRIESLIRRRTSQLEQRSINPLNGIEQKIRENVNSGQKDLLKKVVTSLKNQDLAWRYVLDKKGSTVSRFSDISNLSYVVANLMVTQDTTTFPIIVENPEEAPIARNLKSILDNLAVKFLTLYPHSNAIPNSTCQTGKVNNYFFPQQESQLSVARELVRINKTL